MKVMNEAVVSLMSIFVFILFVAFIGRYLSGSGYSTVDSNYLDHSFSTNIQTRT
jgi:hypothetical protein